MSSDAADRRTTAADTDAGTELISEQERIRRLSDSRPNRPVITGYHVVGDEPLGRGSYGEVWLAEAENCPGKRVAVKFFHHGADHRWATTLETLRVGQFFGTRGIVQL